MLEMLEILISAVRSVGKTGSDQVVAAVRSAMLENVVIMEENRHLEIVDEKGELARVRRSVKYRFRWHAPDYFPPQRINVAPGVIASLVLVEPRGGDYEVLEGGVGHQHCVFRIRAPNVSPTYMVRRRAATDVVFNFEAMDTYRDDDPGPCWWVFRLPKGRSLPRVVNFMLTVPAERAMCTRPRVYRLDDLRRHEGVYTDEGLPTVDGWERLSLPSSDSSLETNEDLTHATWQVRPFKADVAYRIEWDW